MKTRFMLPALFPVLFSACLNMKEPDSFFYEAKKISVVRTPDGKVVLWLNKGSWVRFKQPFDNRVELGGEAYIKIDSTAGDIGAPVTIDAQGIKLRCKRGEFNMNAYDVHSDFYAGQNAGLTEGTLTVIRGRVLVNNRVVLANEVMCVDDMMTWPNDRLVAREQVTWMRGYYQFDDISLVELLKIIRRCYKVHVDYNRAYDFIPLHDVRLVPGEPLSDLLTRIESNSLFKLDYDVANNILWIEDK